jgi:hypothetical protein
MNYMPIDKDIFALATSIIEGYGNEAMRQAAVHANECEAVGDIDGSDTWDHVMHAILELNRTWRRDGELCN